MDDLVTLNSVVHQQSDNNISRSYNHSAVAIFLDKLLLKLLYSENRGQSHPGIVPFHTS
jgi:hypothetical protein